MKIGIVSDLHCEFWSRGEEHLPWLGRRYDVLILAGDIATYCDAVSVAVSAKTAADRVILIAGNHDHYSLDINSSIADLRRASAALGVDFLERSSIVIRGVRFLGCTLWTDYSVMLNLIGVGRHEAMQICYRAMMDHRRIKLGEKSFMPEDALKEHQRSAAWLEYELSVPHSGKTVVVTHHAPSWKSIHPKYLKDPVTAGFASDMAIVKRPVDLWAHGHMHDRAVYETDGTTVVCNPRGYPGENYSDARDYKPFEIEV